ncbi:MAG: hypothetical protein AVDCRST_MAG38-698 [uncultured Solirubrobacteraceae bacterium]|uniref:Uncharacterized protein n=1 Tax=uncultured Solirubrobacteraceae bacterium TaxID=1162706 RepID=A0A6J4R8K2_9ACTN|nr:MAG: hypothetical protein AVDCRST_MAG38-698 [uncultured Solirubrobacteraceae bacterium]
MPAEDFCEHFETVGSEYGRATISAGRPSRSRFGHRARPEGDQRGSLVRRAGTGSEPS